MNTGQGQGHPRLTDARGELGLAQGVQSHRRAIVAQIAEKVVIGYDRKLSAMLLLPQTSQRAHADPCCPCPTYLNIFADQANPFT